jgi:hypothetical protein
MSNHGKKGTNKEGVNIDEMQTKIDMGKLITIAGKSGMTEGILCSVRLMNHLKLTMPVHRPFMISMRHPGLFSSQQRTRRS